MDKFAEYVVDVATAFQKMYRVIVGHEIPLTPSVCCYELNGEERENDNSYHSGYFDYCHEGKTAIEVGCDLHANPFDKDSDDVPFHQNHEAGVDIGIRHDGYSESIDIKYDAENKLYAISHYGTVDSDVHQLMSHFGVKKADFLYGKPDNSRIHHESKTLSETQALEILSALCVIYKKHRALDQAAT